MTIAVENFTVGGSNTSASSVTCNYTTSGTERVVVLAIALSSILAANTTVTSVSDAGGLAWARRKQLLGPNEGTQYSTLEIWWARAPTARAVTAITINFNQAARCQSVISYAVSGLLTPTSPWDGNGSLPASVTNVGASSLPTVPGVSTSAGDGILLGWFDANAFIPSETAGSGFTLIGNQNSEPTSGPGRTYLSAEYKLVAAPQSSVSVDAGPSCTPWHMIADSLAGSAPPPVFQYSRGLIVG